MRVNVFIAGRLRKSVATFFNKVMVMANDEKIRFNGLSHREEISKFFNKIERVEEEENSWNILYKTDLGCY